MRTENGERRTESRWWIVCVVLVFTTFSSLSAQTAIGQWRDCLDYSQVGHVALAPDAVYAGALGGVFRYDLEDYTLTRMSKGKGLNDVGIAALDYSTAARCLVVAYNNSNIDIVTEHRTYNLSDIKRSEIPGDKSIYHIRFHRRLAYLATGFGVVVVDLDRAEIKETWLLGTGGTYAAVYDLAFVGDSLYAATAEGLKRIAAGDPYPTVSDRWTTDSRLATVTLTMLDNLEGRLLAAGYSYDPLNLSLFMLDSTGYHAWNGGDVRSMRVGGGKVTLTRDRGVVRYNGDLVRYDSIDSFDWGPIEATDAVTADNGDIWIGHNWAGLACLHPDGSDHLYSPHGPATRDRCYRLVPFADRMMLCPGGHTTTYASTYIDANLFTAKGERWQSLDKSNGLLDGSYDLLDVAVNPVDTAEMAIALWGTGVAIVRNNRVQTFYDASNSDGALKPYTSGSYSRLNTGAVAYDRQGNLWILNSHSTHALAVRHRNGTWESFSTMGMVSTPEVDRLVWDSIRDYKWVIGRSNTIYVLDGKGKMAKVNPNNGSKLNTESVTALVQDQNGNLWVGTNKGIKVIYDGYRAFQNGGSGEMSPVSCSNITITNGEFAEYLMAYESITAIAVDGANRKWVGTANGGLYLLSANGLEQLEHFTASNSPLFSDKIVTLGIHERTGEVYVGTDRGLQVYRGTATYASSKAASEVHTFPNPVRPDYDGPIAIKGFTRNGIVHITDAAGHTVYSTTAEGGQAIWYGKTNEGRRVASGVYYVFASDDQGNNRSVGKILIVN